MKSLFSFLLIITLTVSCSGNRRVSKRGLSATTPTSDGGTDGGSQYHETALAQAKSVVLSKDNQFATQIALIGVDASYSRLDSVTTSVLADIFVDVTTSKVTYKIKNPIDLTDGQEFSEPIVVKLSSVTLEATAKITINLSVKIDHSDDPDSEETIPLGSEANRLTFAFDEMNLAEEITLTGLDAAAELQNLIYTQSKNYTASHLAGATHKIQVSIKPEDLEKFTKGQVHEDMIEARFDDEGRNVKYLVYIAFTVDPGDNNPDIIHHNDQTIDFGTFASNDAEKTKSFTINPALPAGSTCDHITIGDSFESILEVDCADKKITFKPRKVLVEGVHVQEIVITAIGAGETHKIPVAIKFKRENAAQEFQAPDISAMIGDSPGHYIVKWQSPNPNNKMLEVYVAFAHLNQAENDPAEYVTQAGFTGCGSTSELYSNGKRYWKCWKMVGNSSMFDARLEIKDTQNNIVRKVNIHIFGLDDDIE